MTTPRTRRPPSPMDTTSPRATSSGTRYVNTRASARAVTSGKISARGTAGERIGGIGAGRVTISSRAEAV